MRSGQAGPPKNGRDRGEGRYVSAEPTPTAPGDNHAWPIELELQIESSGLFSSLLNSPCRPLPLSITILGALIQYGEIMRALVTWRGRFIWWRC
jgi:hypothetical protein